MPPRVCRTVEEARAFCERVRLEGRRLAFVPTMGFLHEGHVVLMREGGRRADVVVASIFVNPTQFGPNEDFTRYPRDLDGDLRKCESAGVEMVFVPEASEIYPPGFQSFVEVGEVSGSLEGEKRPGHFRGVATVVAALFNIVRPHVALFGEKDYQQLQVIRALNRDLAFGIEIVGVPTVREADGLARSSRNVYLSPEERKRALALSRGLTEAQRLARSGLTEVAALESAIRRQLREADVREDYVAIVDAETLRPLDRYDPSRPARALVAAFVGKTRLIDNLPLDG